MKQTHFFGLTSLLSTALAAPAYIPYAYNASEPSINGQPVTANNGYFWIGKPTTATCPSYDPDCSSANTTVISGPTFANTCCPNWWMGVLESGGQEIFTSGPYLDGQMGYAAADSNNYLPYRSETSNLNTQNTTDGRVLLKISSYDFSACDDGTGAYKVITGQDNATCIPFAIELKQTTATAVQYYDCAGCETRCDSQDGCNN